MMLDLTTATSPSTHDTTQDLGTHQLERGSELATIDGDTEMVGGQVVSLPVN